MHALTMKAQRTDMLVSTPPAAQAWAVPALHSDAAVEIGGRIRAARQKQSLTLEDLGALAEVAWTNIGKIERGVVSPTVETVVRLAGALNLDQGVLVKGISPDMYGERSHRYTAKDFLAEREQRR